MEYIFRKAKKQDAKEVVSLYKAAVAHMIEINILQWDEIYPNEEVLSGDIDKGELYLLTKEKIITACVVINEEQEEAYLLAPWRYNTGRSAVIHRLCVHPSAQGTGIGKQMMKDSEELIQSNGYESIRLDTFSNNRFARHLYESLGYTYVGEVTFRKGLFYLMEKKIEFIENSAQKD
ncbi:MAG: GNAT family N-acetyltransferase [Mobilitalea sp.]